MGEVNESDFKEREIVEVEGEVAASNPLVTINHM